MFRAPIEELHVDVRAVAVDDEQAPVSAVASFGLAEPVEHLGQPLVAEAVVGPACSRRSEVCCVDVWVQILHPRILNVAGFAV